MIGAELLELGGRVDGDRLRTGVVAAGGLIERRLILDESGVEIGDELGLGSISSSLSIRSSLRIGSSLGVGSSLSVCRSLCVCGSLRIGCGLGIGCGLCICGGLRVCRSLGIGCGLGSDDRGGSRDAVLERRIPGDDAFIGERGLRGFDGGCIARRLRRDIGVVGVRQRVLGGGRRAERQRGCVSPNAEATLTLRCLWHRLFVFSSRRRCRPIPLWRRKECHPTDSRSCRRS